MMLRKWNDVSWSVSYMPLPGLRRIRVGGLASQSIEKTVEYYEVQHFKCQLKFPRGLQQGLDQCEYDT